MNLNYNPWKIKFLSLSLSSPSHTHTYQNHFLEHKFHFLDQHKPTEYQISATILVFYMCVCVYIFYFIFNFILI